MITITVNTGGTLTVNVVSLSAANAAINAQTGAEAAQAAAETAESNAASSASVASTSETNAAASASAAATSATESENAKDAILDKVQTSGLTEGDIARVDANGTYVPIDERISPLAYYSYGNGSPTRIWAADNFEVRGLSPSKDLTGKNYGSSSVGLGGYLTLDTSILGSSSDDQNFRFLITDTTYISITFTSVLLFKDAQNFVEIKFTARNRLIIDETVSNIQTEIYNNNAGSLDGPERAIFQREFYYDNRDQRLYYQELDGGLNRLDLSAFTASGQLNQIGIRADGGDINSRILNYRFELK